MANAILNNTPIQKVSLPSPEDLCLNTALYQKFPVRTVHEFRKLEYFEGTVDCYCQGCQKHSVFKAKEKEFKPLGRVETDGLLNYVFRLILVCSRDQEHQLLFLYRVHDGQLDKIGQSPSLSDLAAPDLRKYRAVLGEEKHRELVRGVGLFSHDVGIGAFVYLRRVFEHLIDVAHTKAVAEPTWDEAVFRQSRMAEKIELLKSFLPQFLIENRRLYGILSSGVHELAEQDCLEAFPVVKVGIELILDDELERHRRDMKIEAAKRALDRTAHAIANS